MNKIMLHIKKIINAVLVIVISHAHAADSSLPSVENEFLDLPLDQLMQVNAYTVTASKMLENVDKSIATVTVIDSLQIRSMGARHLLDVLRIVPGLGVVAQGEWGLPELEARGIKTPNTSTGVLLMINGHPVDHNIQNGGSLYVYGDMPIHDVEKVEVVRGTGSALYGANAFLAVINVITKQASDVNGVEITGRGGSFANQQYNISAGKDFNGLKLGGNFNYTDSDGFHALIKQDSLTLAQQPSNAPGYTKPYNKRYDLSWNAEYQDFKLDGRFINKQMGTFIGFGSFGPESNLELTDYFLRLAYNHKFNDQLSLSSKTHYTSFSFQNLWQTQPNGYFNAAATNTKIGNETQLTYQLTDKNTLIAGFFIEHQRQSQPVAKIGTAPDNLQPTANWGIPTGRFLWSLYGQDMWDVFDNLRLMAGVRYDNYSDFGSTINPRVGLNWQMTKDYSFRFSYGTAFRAPTFGETTLVNNPNLLGNPNLKPEKIETFELGLSAHFTPALFSQLTLYHSNIKDIIRQKPVSTAVAQFSNTDTATSQGIEWETKYNFTKNTYLGFNYVYQNATDRNNRRLANTPKHRANLMANIEFSEQVNFYADALFTGSSIRETGDSRNHSAGYAFVNTSLSFRDIGIKGWEANFSIYNLLDKNYTLPASIAVPEDLPQPGRTFFGSIKVKF